MASIACPQAGTRDNGELKPWDGRSPLSIAAAIIYLVTRLPKVASRPVLPSDAIEGHAVHRVSGGCQ